MLLSAEIGLNHDGDFTRAREMIRQAKLAGADIAKFQFGWRGDPDEMNHIDRDTALDLRECCHQHDIEMLASVFTDDALELARRIDLDRYKIASRTVSDDPDLCKRILSDGKETFVSLGMWDGDGWPFGPPDDTLRYVYCVSKYPTPPADLSGMPDRFHEDGYYGYSDHLLGIEGCLLAIGRGAEYVEKHFTLDKTSQVIRDHVLSATPEELERLDEVGRPLARLADTVTGSETEGSP